MRVMLLSLSLLAVVVTALVLMTLALEGIFHVLSLEVALKLPKLSLDLVLAVLAYHLDRPEAILSLPQFVLFLLLGAPGFLHVDALVDTTAISLPHLHTVNILVQSALCAGCPTRVLLHREGRCIHERVLSHVGGLNLRRGLLIHKN